MLIGNDHFVSFRHAHFAFKSIPIIISPLKKLGRVRTSVARLKKSTEIRKLE